MKKYQFKHTYSNRSLFFKSAEKRWKSGEISTSLFLQIVTLQDLERRVLEKINTIEFVMEKFRRNAND